MKRKEIEKDLKLWLMKTQSKHAVDRRAGKLAHFPSGRTSRLVARTTDSVVAPQAGVVASWTVGQALRSVDTGGVLPHFSRLPRLGGRHATVLAPLVLRIY